MVPRFESGPQESTDADVSQCARPIDDVCGGTFEVSVTGDFIDLADRAEVATEWLLDAATDTAISTLIRTADPATVTSLDVLIKSVEPGLKSSGREFSSLMTGMGAAKRLTDAALCVNGYTPPREIRLEKADAALTVLEKTSFEPYFGKNLNPYEAEALATSVAALAASEVFLGIIFDDVPLDDIAAKHMAMIMQELCVEIAPSVEKQALSSEALGHIAELAILNVLTSGISFDQRFDWNYAVKTMGQGLGLNEAGVATDVDFALKESKPGRTHVQAKMAHRRTLARYKKGIRMLSVEDMSPAGQRFSSSISQMLRWHDQTEPRKNRTYDSIRQMLSAR